MKRGLTILFAFMSLGLHGQTKGTQLSGDTLRTPTFHRHHCYAYSKRDDRKYFPLVIIDGKRSKRRALKRLKTENVTNIEIVKNKEALTAFGSNGKYGVLIITTNSVDKKKKT